MMKLEAGSEVWFVIDNAVMYGKYCGKVTHLVPGVTDPVYIDVGAVTDVIMPTKALSSTKEIAEAERALAAQQLIVERCDRLIVTEAMLLHQIHQEPRALRGKEGRRAQRNTLFERVEHREKMSKRSHGLHERLWELKNPKEESDVEEVDEEGTLYVVTCGDGEVVGVYTTASQALDAALEVANEDSPIPQVLETEADLRVHNELSAHRTENQVFIKKEVIE